MRNFFLFIIRHYAAFFFILLELISLWLMFSSNAFQNTWFVNSANAVSGNVLDTYNNFDTYFSLKSVNDSLLNENARLREQLVQSRQFDTIHQYEIKDSSGTVIYTYIPAEIISNTYTELNNFITLNKGTNHGITYGMGVITSNGIVGKVIKASPNFAVVQSVLNTDFASRVAIKHNNAQGRLKWEGSDPTVISMIDVSEPGQLTEGDTIITTAVSSIYPPGTMVGTLKDYGKEAGKNFYKLNISLTVKFSSLHYVYVVNYLRKEEKEKIEEEAKNAGN